MLYKLVPQEHYSGCSVACVASVLGWPYDYARTLEALFPADGDPENKGFYSHQIVEAFIRAGRRYNWAYVKTMPEEQFTKLINTPGSIVYVDNSQGLPRGHYLTCCEPGKWINPWANFREWPATAAIVDALPGNPLYVIYSLWK